MNSVSVQSLDSATFVVLAPGANKSNTKIKVDKKENCIKIESKPTIDPKEIEVDLDVKETLHVDNLYDVQTTHALIKDGIITLTIKVSSERISTIKAE